MSESELKMSGLHIRRDEYGTLHITGAPLEMIECVISGYLPESEHPTLCVHYPHQTCPGEGMRVVFTSFAVGWTNQATGTGDTLKP